MNASFSAAQRLRPTNSSRLTPQTRAFFAKSAKNAPVCYATKGSRNNKFRIQVGMIV